MVSGISFNHDEIHINKQLNKLDKFVIDGVKTISKYFPSYVIVAGYISILFGRSRTTEDVDVLIHPEDITNEKVERFYEDVERSDFWIFNALTSKSGYELLNQGLPIRMAKLDSIIPNFEIKKAKKDVELEAVRRRIKVILNGFLIYISSIELNIAYKLYLGSQKDVEDAVYLYCFFKEYINIEELYRYLSLLNVNIDDVIGVLKC